MAAFEYLSVLISIILALGMTRVLAGVGEMLQARSRHRIYWVHVMWIVNLFLYLVIAWWIFYRWRDQQPWNFYLFLFVLISPTIFIWPVRSSTKLLERIRCPRNKKASSPEARFLDQEKHEEIIQSIASLPFFPR